MKGGIKMEKVLNLYKVLMLTLLISASLYVGGIPNASAAPNIHLDIDDTAQVILERGRVLVKAYIHNYGDTGATLTRVQLSIWIENGNDFFNFTDKNFYPQNMYVGAGQKIWHTFYFDDPSVPYRGQVAARVHYNTWWN